jgi:hypothetical protein
VSQELQIVNFLNTIWPVYMRNQRRASAPVSAIAGEWKPHSWTFYGDVIQLAVEVLRKPLGLDQAPTAAIKVGNGRG